MKVRNLDSIVAFNGVSDASIIDLVLFSSENNRCIQAKGRGALWQVESKVDKMDAQTLLSLLLRQELSHSKSRVLERSGSQSGRS